MSEVVELKVLRRWAEEDAAADVFNAEQQRRWDAVERAIRKIVDYVEAQERNDYESRDSEGRANHIYRSVEIVRDWLNQRPPSAA